MIEWIWPWMLALAPLPWLVQRFAPVAHNRQPALRVPFFQEWRSLNDAESSNVMRHSLFAVSRIHCRFSLDK